MTSKFVEIVPLVHRQGNGIPSAAIPGAYALKVDGDCMAPVVNDGDKVLASAHVPPKAGELGIIYMVNGEIWVKRLLMVPPPEMMNLHPDSTVMPLLAIEMLNPHKRGHIEVDKIKAIHGVAAVVRQDTGEVVRHGDGVLSWLPMGDEPPEAVALAGGEDLEPIGHLTFPATGEKPITAQTTWEDFCAHARWEYLLLRAILPIINASDTDLEKRIRAADEMEVFMKLTESCMEAKDRCAAGVETYDAAFARLMIVLERVYGDEAAEPAAG